VLEQSKMPLDDDNELRMTDETPPQIENRRTIAWVTYLIIAVCGGLTVYLRLGEGLPHYANVVQFLAPRSFLIWTGSWWGIATSAFVHFEIWHILFNMLWTMDLGRLLEPTMGRRNFTLFILAAAVISSGVQLALSGQTGIGFSGVVYAMFGYGMAVRQVHPTYNKVVNTRTIVLLLGWLVVSVVLTYTEFLSVANWAHFGGLAFGYCLGKGLLARERVVPYRIALVILTVLTIMSVAWLPWSEQWLQRSDIRYAWDLFESGDREEQYEVGLAQLNYYNDVDSAIQLLSLSAKQGYVPAMSSLAWILSTNSDAAIRDGDMAVSWAWKACEADNWESPDYVDTLAAAYAEADMWAQAVDTQELAIEKLRVGGNTWLESEYTSRLQRYMDHQKVRE